MATVNKFPEKIPHSLQNNTMFYRTDDLFALEGSSHKNAMYELTTRSKVFSVFDSRSSSEKPDSAIPLYKLGESGAPVLPTGLVFVRFSSETIIEAMESSLKSIGYRIANERTGHHNAAWLESIDGSIETALANLRQLGSLQEIEEVQPQFLSRRAKR